MFNFGLNLDLKDKNFKIENFLQFGELSNDVFNLKNREPK